MAIYTSLQQYHIQLFLLKLHHGNIKYFETSVQIHLYIIYLQSYECTRVAIFLNLYTVKVRDEPIRAHTKKQDEISIYLLEPKIKLLNNQLKKHAYRVAKCPFFIVSNEAITFEKYFILYLIYLNQMGNFATFLCVYQPQKTAKRARHAQSVHFSTAGIGCTGAKFSTIEIMLDGYF